MASCSGSPLIYKQSDILRNVLQGKLPQNQGVLANSNKGKLEFKIEFKSRPTYDVKKPNNFPVWYSYHVWNFHWNL